MKTDEEYYKLLRRVEALEKRVAELESWQAGEETSRFEQNERGPRDDD